MSSSLTPVRVGVTSTLAVSVRDIKTCLEAGGLCVSTFPDNCKWFDLVRSLLVALACDRMELLPSVTNFSIQSYGAPPLCSKWVEVPKRASAGIRLQTDALLLFEENSRHVQVSK